MYGARTDIKNHKKKSPQAMIRNKNLLSKFKAYEKGYKEKRVYIEPMQLICIVHTEY